jgi:hypothetical protein
MSWIALFLGLVLALAGGAAFAASIDLLTTELGLLYATCGAIGLSGGIITLAIGLLIRRVDAVRRALLREREEEPRPIERAEPLVPPLLAGIEPVIFAEPAAAQAPPTTAPVREPEAEMAPPSQPDGAEALEEAPINENRKGHLPAFEELEPAGAPAPAKPPGPPPTLVGRYSAGGADYSIFSDGSIEAQTSQGDFKFASMREFKDFIAAKRS